MSNNTKDNNTKSKTSNFKLFSFLVKKRKKTTNNVEQMSSELSSNNDVDMFESPPTAASATNSKLTTSSSPDYVDATKTTSLGALSQTSYTNPRNSARIIRRTDNEGFKNKVNNRKSAAFTNQIVF